MERKSNFVKCLLFGMLVGAVVWVTGCGDLLGIADGVQNTIVQAATGTQEWDAYDAFEFRTQKLYKRDSESPITSGDIYLVPATSPTQYGANDVWFWHRLINLNAKAIYNAGIDTSIDCRTVLYNQGLSEIELAERQENWLIPTVVCINTQENNIAKMVFREIGLCRCNILSFDWTYYPVSYAGYKVVSPPPAKYDSKVLEDLKSNEWVPVLVYLKNEHNLSIYSVDTDEKVFAVQEQQKKINAITIKDVLPSLAAEDFGARLKYSGNGLRGSISRQGFEKLIKNPKVYMISPQGGFILREKSFPPNLLKKDKQ